MSSPSAQTVTRTARWLWPLVVVAAVWVVVARVPIVLNAQAHLDSDMAVDGLCVLDVARGHWHWHFPGTPHIGIASAVFAAAQLRALGASAEALASGGVLEYLALAGATLWLAFVGFGPRVAAWSLVPLAFTSTGMIWLSGRLNSGHLLAAAWHAGAIALLHGALHEGGPKRSALLGLWCGLGLWHDSMFVMTLVTLVPVAVLAWLLAGRSRGAYRCALAIVLALGVGGLPYVLGKRLEPYDAYREQFSPVSDTSVLAEHARILGFECLPRLIAGHLLPDFRSEPAPEALAGRPARHRSSGEIDVLAATTTVCALGLFAAAILALAIDRTSERDWARWAVRWELLLASGAVAAGFVVNRNIFNSDNYRYIITMFVPWSVGLGLLFDRVARRGAGGAVLAALLALAFSTLMTLDTVRWYRQFGWISEDGVPVRAAVHDLALDWLREHPEVTSIYGGYWDVYRLTFLLDSRVRGVPFPTAPNRYPEWSKDLPDGRPEILLVRPSFESELFRQQAIREGATVLLMTPELAIYRWPTERPARG